ncbi:MAG TPA: hypothetical protein VHE59_01250 [Mucilaginibacter sp.]|nr:hypothetical protein [Mucilaginibacter sp.]
MNKKVLIISPYFPPSNAADMQRIRMSLPYFGDFGWDAEMVTVDPKYSEMPVDELLVQSLPQGVKIHYIKAFSKKWTSLLGLGSIALRSLYFYRKKVSRLLKNNHFDLVYFSTTQFPVCVLGAYWKKRFKVPYVIDMQDPWHSEYYRDKPKDQQPPKYWFSYRLNKYLEPKAMKSVGGLISVSESYIHDLKTRYPGIKNIPAATITFGAFDADMQIAQDHAAKFAPLLDANTTNIVYIGRGGVDMHRSVSVLFDALKKGIDRDPELFKRIRLYFIGTSYAPAGRGKPSILPVAKEMGVESSVVEKTDRISYYHTLLTLQQAGALFIPGSDDPKYTASKIYPYLLTHKPLLAVFNPNSPAIASLTEYGVKDVYGYDTDKANDIYQFLKCAAEDKLPAPVYNANVIQKYSARNMTMMQCRLFDEVIHGKN